MPKYDAFISYRHTEPDKTIAEKLHKMLETYKVPSKIAKKRGKRKLTVFSETRKNFLHPVI